MTDTTPTWTADDPGVLSSAAGTPVATLPAPDLGPDGADDTAAITAKYGSPKRTVALVLIAAVGGYLMMLTLATALSLRIALIDPEGKEAVYSRIVSVAALLMLVAIPLVGALSDRTTSRFGRRRPWIVAGLVVSLACFALIGMSTSFLVIGIAYVVGITAAQAGFNAYAVIPVEGIPDRMRARVMGLMGLFGALAMSGGSFLAGALVSMPVLLMTVPILAATVTMLPLLLMYRDPVRDKADVPALDVVGLAKTFFVDPRKHPDFGWTWLSRFLAGAAMTAMLGYFIYFLMSGLHVPIEEVGAKAGLLTLASAPISILFFTGSGWLSDKVGRRKPFVAASAVLMAIALVVGGTATSFTQFLVAWLIFAMGQAMYLTVDLALCASVLPNQADAGKDMAVFGLALNLPGVLVPAVAPLLLGASANYVLFWGFAAVLCLAGAAVVPMIKGVR
ncbi:MAG TPA: MFS transporter [Propionibacteriaceae bacterium]|nr:MFS transporter [Propionibacteriaceae bacterium]